MKLPNHELAQVPEPKIVAYLLAPTHRFGRHKAGYFLRFGFNATDWEILATAVKWHSDAHDVTKGRENSLGKPYVVGGELRCPDGPSPLVRSVSIVVRGQITPRFVTAIPLRSKRD